MLRPLFVASNLMFWFALQAAGLSEDRHWSLVPIDACDPYVLVLGTAQDGGFPQAGCQKPCCRRAWENPGQARMVVSLAIVDPSSGDRWLIECTPDFKHQLHLLEELAPQKQGLGISGIFLTHAHIGHYAGLVNLGREVMGARQIPTYVMPRMGDFLRTNGPWRQLVELGNVDLRPLELDREVELSPRVAVTPIGVPHRDEFSETVAFRICGPNRSILFLPDIDKWDRWERAIESELERVDIAFLDATFFDSAELPGRDMNEIPHPFAVESIQRFASLPPGARAKIHFIHFNHTNPLLDEDSSAVRQVHQAGMHLAEQGMRIGL